LKMVKVPFFRSWLLESCLGFIAIRRGISKEVEDGNRPPALEAGHS
jgi:hypothetical protein